MTNRRTTTHVKLLGLCRGSGKGYIKIATDLEPETLTARAHVLGGTDIVCPIYRIGFPGEDMMARKVSGEDMSNTNLHTAVVVVPLLDKLTLGVRIHAGDSDDTAAPLWEFPFKTFETKVKSRLTYKYHPDFASQIRDIDRRRISGDTSMYIGGAYPAEDHAVSFRFHVRHPYTGSPEPCDITVLNPAGNRFDTQPLLLKRTVTADPNDSLQRIQDTEYSLILPDGPHTLCILAQPERHSGNFICISEPMYMELLNRGIGETKNFWNGVDYRSWFEQRRATWADIANQRKVIASWDRKPLVSIVTPVFRPPIEYLKSFIDSVLAQSYEHFELILVNVSGDSPDVTAALDNLADPRVTIITAENKTISENTNIGITHAKGEYIAFVDHDDVIEPDALYRYMSEIHRHPDTDLMYCDEDALDNGVYVDPTFKPQFNQDLLYCNNYITHMLMVSHHVLEQVDLSGPDVSGAQDYDLTLKCAEKARRITGVQRVLYHWRRHPNSTSINSDSKPYAEEAGRLALSHHFARTGVAAEVSGSEFVFRYRSTYSFTRKPKVSIIIPAGELVDPLASCVDSILEGTAYGNFDITIVGSGAPESAAERYETICGRDSRIHMVFRPGPSTEYSAIRNFGAAHSDGDLLLFLDTGIRTINDSWMDSMTGFFARPNVGVTGAKLLSLDGLVQNGGVWVDVNSTGHYGERMSHTDGGYMETLRYPVDVAAVDSACQMIRRELFTDIGGYDERFSETLNGVDLSLAAGRLGYLVVFDPDATLYHTEHIAAEDDNTSDMYEGHDVIKEQALFRTKWSGRIERGRYLNANLDQTNGHYAMAR